MVPLHCDTHNENCTFGMSRTNNEHNNRAGVEEIELLDHRYITELLNPPQKPLDSLLLPALLITPKGIINNNNSNL